MTITYASHDVLGRMTADVQQLTRRIHVAVRGSVVTHPALLDSLREATTPAGAALGEAVRRSVPGSRPPARLDPIEVLSEVYTELAGWHAKLRLPSPPAFIHGCHHMTCRQVLLDRRCTRGPLCAAAKLQRADWQKTVLRQLVAEAPKLAPQIGDWLAADVQSWWSMAAHASGWRPAELIRIR